MASPPLHQMEPFPGLAKRLFLPEIFWTVKQSSALRGSIYVAGSVLWRDGARATRTTSMMPEQIACGVERR